MLAPFAVDQAADLCSCGHENDDSAAGLVCMSWTATGTRTTAVGDLSDIIRIDWPKVGSLIRAQLYGAHDPVPVEALLHKSSVRLRGTQTRLEG